MHGTVYIENSSLTIIDRIDLPYTTMVKPICELIVYWSCVKYVLLRPDYFINTSFISPCKRLRLANEVTK